MKFAFYLIIYKRDGNRADAAHTYIRARPMLQCNFPAPLLLYYNKATNYYNIILNQSLE